MVNSKGTPEKRFFPKDYQPCSTDIVCGRGSECFNHDGNQAFRKVISEILSKYAATNSRHKKSMIVVDIINNIRSQGKRQCRFIRFSKEEKRWYEISEAQVRQKVGQCIRDTIMQHDPQKLSRKNQRRRLCRALREGNANPSKIFTNKGALTSWIIETQRSPHYTYLDPRDDSGNSKQEQFRWPEGPSTNSPLGSNLSLSKEYQCEPAGDTPRFIGRVPSFDLSFVNSNRIVSPVEHIAYSYSLPVDCTHERKSCPLDWEQDSIEISSTCSLAWFEDIDDMSVSSRLFQD